MSKVEDVARILAGEYADEQMQDQGDDKPYPYWFRMVSKARAAIAAMRKPTKQQLEAGSDNVGESAEVIYTAMIDAALADGQKDEKS